MLSGLAVLLGAWSTGVALAPASGSVSTTFVVGVVGEGVELSG